MTARLAEGKSGRARSRRPVAAAIKREHILSIVHNTIVKVGATRGTPNAALWKKRKN
jgi:hypothetical protein